MPGKEDDSVRKVQHLPTWQHGCIWVLGGSGVLCRVGSCACHCLSCHKTVMLDFEDRSFVNVAPWRLQLWTAPALRGLGHSLTGVRIISLDISKPWAMKGPFTVWFLHCPSNLHSLKSAPLTVLLGQQGSRCTTNMMAPPTSPQAVRRV